MNDKSREAQTMALKTLTEIMGDKTVKIEVRVEAAKLILNRPRFFVSQDAEEV